MIARALAIALTLVATATPSQDAPDLILHDARILTMAEPAEAQAIAIADGVVEAVGPDTEITALADAGTRMIDLDGAVVVPGLIDNHTHVVRSMGGDPTRLADLAAGLNRAGVTTLVDAGGFNFDPGTRQAAYTLDDRGDLTVRVLFLEWLPGTSIADAQRNAANLASLDTASGGLTQLIGVGETLFRPLHDRPIARSRSRVRTARQRPALSGRWSMRSYPCISTPSAMTQSTPISISSRRSRRALRGASAGRFTTRTGSPNRPCGGWPISGSA